jgi:hypothetical protein
MADSSSLIGQTISHYRIVEPRLAKLDEAAIVTRMQHDSLLTKVPRVLSVLLMIIVLTPISLSHLLAGKVMENRAIAGPASALSSEPWTDAETVQPISSKKWRARRAPIAP